MLPLLTALSLAAGACASGGLSPSGEGGTNNDAVDNNDTVDNNGADCPSSACSIGQTICTASTEVQACEADPDGCGVFALAETCMGGEVCIDGRCAAGCIDNDGDGHGNGCANGPDCDDTDFDKHQDKVELCDNKDNDCDTEIDEGDTCAADCSAQECEPAERECASPTSIRECRQDNSGCGSWGPAMDCGGSCTGDRCEGCVDNDGDQRGDNCAFGPDCDDTDGTIFANAPELCDSKDNDCDNQTDEGDVCAADCSNAPCNLGEAECVDADRIRECVDNGFGCGQWGNATACGGGCSAGNCGDCVDNDNDLRGDGCAFGSDCNDGDPTVYENAPEICDDKDNDCDNATDEDYADLGDSCSSGMGACRTEGTRVCSAGGFGTVCNALAGSGSDELCGDSADNDCDGDIDEGFEARGQGCSDGVGECRESGQLVCSNNGRDLVCNATASNPTAEVCDGLDNDCNNIPDDGVCEGCVDDPNGENDSSSGGTPIAQGQSANDAHCGVGGGSDRDWFDLGSFTSGQSVNLRLEVFSAGCELHMEVYVGSDFSNASPRTSGSLDWTHSVNFTGAQRVWVFPDANPNSNCSYRISHL